MTRSHQLLHHQVNRLQNTFNAVVGIIERSIQGIKEFVFLPWQNTCFHKLKDLPYWQINAPMGAGKTLVMLALAWYKLKKDPSLRIIISGPQKIICAGYKGGFWLWLSKLEKIFPCPNYDLSEDSPEEEITQNGKIRKKAKETVLFDFLTRVNSGSVSDRLLICPHSTLRNAFITEQRPYRINEKTKQLLKNILIMVDEAHHSEFGETEGHTIEANGIGAIVRYALENPNLNVQLGLTTATPYRGNRTPMILSKYKHLFTTYELGWPEYFETTNIDVFTHDFVLYTGTLVEPVEKIFRASFQPTICFIPRVNSIAASDSKHDDVHMFYESISGCSNPQIRNENGYCNGITEVYSTIENRWLRGINLVGEINRIVKKQAIIDDDDAKERGLDFIVALQMFVEGANWRWASREIIIGQRLSFTEYIQMMGRLFRRTGPPKGTIRKNLVFYHLLPYSLFNPNETELREACNIRLNAVIYLMLAIDIWIPAPIKLVDAEPPEPIDVDETAVIFEQIMREAMRIAATQGDITREQLYSIVESILIDHGEDTSHTQEIVDRIIHVLEIINHTITKMPDGIDLTDITLNLVKNGGILGDGSLLHFMSEDLGTHTWKACFDILQTSWDAKLEEVKKVNDWKKEIMKDRNHPLNHWLFEQWRAYDGNRLEERQHRALETLPGWKNQKFDAADDGLQRLLQMI